MPMCFRQTHKGSFGGQQEFYQSGVELIGAGDVSADAEIVLLVADILDHLSLPQWSLVLGGCLPHSIAACALSRAHAGAGETGTGAA